MSDRVGQQLGNYRLVSLLGQGGFAEVYLGEHVFLKTRAAIKVLHTQVAKDDMEGFLTEARIIANLVHPHIVRVLEFGLEGNTPFLVMDYAPNGTLRQRHPKGTRLSLQAILVYVKQIADALSYAHDERLIHRDIKPENMLVGRRNDILLSDFGIALIAQSSRYQSTQGMAGTVAYMAPEQIQGKPRPASDQYALGVVIYEWVSGDRPFHGTITEIAVQHAVALPPPLHEKVPTILPGVEDVVMKALAKDPKQRFGSVQAFAEALEQASRVSPGETINEAKIPSSQLQQPTRLATPLSQAPLPPTQLALPSDPSTSPRGAMISPGHLQRQSVVTESPVPKAAAKVNLVPLGLGAFAVTMLALGLFDTNLISDSAAIIGLVAYLSLFGSLVQVIAGVQALRTGDSFAGTALCSYGGFPLALGYIIFMFAPGIQIASSEPTYLYFYYTHPHDAYQTIYQSISFFLLSWTIFTTLLFLASLRHYRALIALFASLLLTFLSLTLGQLGVGDTLTFTMIGGYFGILTAILAAGITWYAVTHRSVLATASAAKTNPTSLGLSAFAVTLFFVSLANINIIAPFSLYGIELAGGLMLFYGGLMELIAGVLAWRSGNSFGAVAFCSNGVFWFVLWFVFDFPVVFWFFFNFQSFNRIEMAFGFFLLIGTIFNVVAFVTALKTNTALAIVFFTAALTFLALSIGAFAFPDSTFTNIGGWLGIATAVLAWYTVLALLLTDVKKPLLLPLGRRSQRTS
jgi:succinate-acetate transporter protein/serine/threonine protein kinase